jgi:hypothetical protein
MIGNFSKVAQLVNVKAGNLIFLSRGISFPTPRKTMQSRRIWSYPKKDLASVMNS